MKKISNKKTTKKVISNSVIKRILKRDGSVIDFDIERIVVAVHKAMIQTGEGNLKEAEYIAHKVNLELKKVAKYAKSFVLNVEGVQDLVEQQLMMEDFIATAKSYILYRQERSRIRKVMAPASEKMRKLTEESKKYFRNPLAEFIFYRTYARWIETEKRRETWIEAVDRYMDFMRENLGEKLTNDEYGEIREGILKQEVMPSMRLMQFAGKPARYTNVCAYNCAYIAPTKLQDFGEIMYLSMCGAGVGFSVESITAQQLPIVQKQTGKKQPVYIVDDSKEGWADAFVSGLKVWFSGEDIEFDYSKLRPAGTRLMTMGGKSSGSDPLRALMIFSREKILKKQGKRLTNLDVHDVICKIGQIVVSGGVRRSALISLSDLDDNDMRHAKSGQFYISEPQRMMANNSAVYLEKPSSEEFVEEWLSLMKGRSGERGIFNRGSLKYQLPKRRLKVTDIDAMHMGTNPCGEIILRSKQFCNLSEVVAREDDTEDSLMRKARLATIIGTYQSSLTKFGYLSKEWKTNCEEEALLGVSITGQWDSNNSRNESILEKIRDEVIKVNKEYAKKFGVNQSTSVTSIKPSGTVSQLVDSSSGMHPRHSKYYIRRVRISASDSLFKMLKDQGVPYHPEVGQSENNATTYVLEFPVEAPSNTKTFKDDLSALEQLYHWKKVKISYTEHNPSTTISIGEDEWIAVANWLYNNWDILGGLSFLPRSDYVYQLAPYEAITKKQYEEIKKRFAHIDFSKIVTYEKLDETEVKLELACVAGGCEI